MGLTLAILLGARLHQRLLVQHDTAVVDHYVVDDPVEVELTIVRAGGVAVAEQVVEAVRVELAGYDLLHVPGEVVLISV